MKKIKTFKYKKVVANRKFYWLQGFICTTFHIFHTNLHYPKCISQVKWRNDGSEVVEQLANGGGRDRDTYATYTSSEKKIPFKALHVRK
jgi:hypothetical protein